MLQELLIKEIGPHPQNPRKSLGDLTELTDSIRAFGVMQNLTVVPAADTSMYKYTVIIGHRRLAAAHEAGLETVPCQIAELNEVEQIETMLAENMQREDLTPLEEAKGFQMMLDLGKSVEEICSKTGLSETKVRHRIKLNELDESLLEKKLGCQVRMNDLIKLEQIKNIDDRNEVLKSIGTNNFDWTLKQALKKQMRDEIEKKLREALEDKYKEVTTPWQYDGAFQCDLEAYEEKEQEALDTIAELMAEKSKIYIYLTEYSVGIYTDKPKKDEEDDEEARLRKEKQQRERERKDKLENLEEEFNDLHIAFIQDCQETDIKNNQQLLNKAILTRLLIDGVAPYADWILNAFNIEDGSQSDLDRAIDEFSSRRFKLAFLLSTYHRGYNSVTDTTDWQGEYRKDSEYPAFLMLIEKFGYNVSDEERAYADGSHTLYIKED